MATNMEASMFSMFIMFNMHVCACMCVHVCVCVSVCIHGTPPTHSYPPPTHFTHPPPLQGGTSRISKNLITQDISILFKDLTSVKKFPTHGWVCGWLGGWMGQWMGSGQMTKNLINLDLIEIIQFCLKIL